MRIVPISHKILPFIKYRMKHSVSPYVFITDSGKQLDYRNFKDAYFDPIMKDLGMPYTIKHCRATFRRLMVQSGVNSFMIKKIMGTKQRMTLTERVYIHPEICLLYTSPSPRD